MWLQTIGLIVTLTLGLLTASLPAAPRIWSAPWAKMGPSRSWGSVGRWIGGSIAAACGGR